MTVQTTNTDKAMVSDYNAWRQQGLQSIQRFNSLHDVVLERESGHVKEAVCQVRQAQQDQTDVKAWAKHWAQALLQPHDTEASVRAGQSVGCLSQSELASIVLIVRL